MSKTLYANNCTCTYCRGNRPMKMNPVQLELTDEEVAALFNFFNPEGGYMEDTYYDAIHDKIVELMGERNLYQLAQEMADDD